MWGSTNNKPPGPIIRMGQSETGSTSQFMIITLFFWQTVLLVGSWVMGLNFELLVVKITSQSWRL
jgi:hypothetical protein